MAAAKAKCGAKKHQGQGLCARPAGWGTDHPGWGRCKLHGGSAPAGVRAAAVQRAQGKAAEVLARLDVPPCVDPLAELERLAGQVVAWKDTCAENLNRLRGIDLRYESKLAVEQIRGEVVLWEKSLSLAVATLTGLAKLHISEQRARIDERKANVLVAAFAASLEAAQLSPEAANVVRGDFVRRMRALTA